MKLLRVLLLSILIPISIQAHPGIGLVYDGNNTIYFSDLIHIWKMNTQTGEASIFLENIHSHELWLDDDGVLYGEHYWYEESNQVFKHYIWMATPDGELTKISDNKIGENDHFSFVRESTSEFYSTQPWDSFYQLTKTTPDTVITFPDFILINPSWMYLTSDSELYILDRDSINEKVRLHCINFNDSSQTIIADNLNVGRFPFSLLDHHTSAYGIWEDDQSNMYVALYGGRQVIRIDEDLNQETILKTSFYWSPINGVFDANNNLWLMEASLRGKVRLRKIEAEF